MYDNWCQVKCRIFKSVSQNMAQLNISATIQNIINKTIVSPALVENEKKNCKFWCIVKCFSGKKTICKVHSKLHPGLEWRIFLSLSSEDIDDVLSRFNAVVCAKILLFIDKKKIKRWLKDALVRIIVFLPLENIIYIFAPPCNTLYIFSFFRTQGTWSLVAEWSWWGHKV